MRVPSAPAKGPAPASLIDLGLKPSRTTLAMTAAMMHQEGQLFQKPIQVAGNDEMPFLRGLENNQWGSPAELYNELRKRGATKYEAEEYTRRNIKLGNPDLDVDELMRKSPQS